MPIRKKLYIRTNTVLIGIIIALCAGLAFLSGCILIQTAENIGYVLYIKISVVVLLLLALVLAALTIKIASRNPSEEILALLKRFKREGDSTPHPRGEISDIVTALDEMMSELRNSLQSVQVKAQAIDRDVEMLAKGIHQVAADQTNLFSLSAAIETVRSQQDGFSVISGEILSLVERTGRLTDNVRSMASQLRAGIIEIAAELEHLLRRVDPNRTGVKQITDHAEKSDQDRPA
jgi:methyl-accepting chemotaxis protein